MRTPRGLTIALSQMSVIPGKPDMNARSIIQEIESAKERDVDIIIFPELATTGYIVGDVFEDDFFIEDVLRWNKKVVQATHESNIIAIFGSVVTSPSRRGEDGRARKHNAVVIAQNGRVIAEVHKTLQPNYRFFNDDKHFTSSRKSAEEQNLPASSVLKPIPVKTRKGVLPLGVMLCEDMWHADYPIHPAKILAEKGAKLIINISASPWTWQKNRKRHQVIKNSLTECKIPFVYVNTTGAQNTGKNIIVFDGSSAVYSKRGEIVFEVPAYETGTRDFTFAPRLKPLPQKPQDDTKELYDALVRATKSVVPPDTKVVVGLSGGIDSAVVCAHLQDALGRENVIALNMPMSEINSEATRDMARRIAENLGVAYEIVPIDEIVEITARIAGIPPNTLGYENIQARARKDILAAYAQKINGVFVCCSNKIEMAFGYGTLYGDIAGFYAPLGDLVKREVRQIAEYLNRERFKREVIPEECINQKPTAELTKNQTDPFDYGGRNRRGYHDEMVRAFTEFRKNPEWFLEKYLKGTLEEELELEKGTLARLFPHARDLANDLRSRWSSFNRSFFKRIQAPPIPVFSKRAFGRDLEESLMLPHLTGRYQYLEEYVFSRDASSRERIVVFGGSMNPPGLHHKLMAEELTRMFNKVLVVPCGMRKDKPSIFVTTPEQRKTMTLLTFQNIPGIELDFSDLENDVFTPTYLLEERYRKQFPDTEIWFAVGSDIVEGGGNENSEIQRTWVKGKEVWEKLNFAIVYQPGRPVELADLPPSSRVIEIELILGRSTTIRKRLEEGLTIDNLVADEVARYIEKEGLYRKN